MIDTQIMVLPDKLLCHITCVLKPLKVFSFCLLTFINSVHQLQCTCAPLTSNYSKSGITKPCCIIYRIKWVILHDLISLSYYDKLGTRTHIYLLDFRPRFQPQIGKIFCI